MIVVEHLYKSFRIPRGHKLSVRQSLFSFFDRQLYDSLEVLNDFSLTVRSGEFIGIMGANGSGKSTFLKILAGVYEADSGSIQLGGRISALLELGVGFHPELSARQNVLLNASLLGFTKSKLIRCFREIFCFAGLESFVDVPLKHFSSGMAARLAFSIAKEVEADIYLLDEVLAVGDHSFQIKCFQVFDQWKKDGKTVLFVSHSEELLKSLSDRIVSFS